jgi:hypothetical protein
MIVPQTPVVAKPPSPVKEVVEPLTTQVPPPPQQNQEPNRVTLEQENIRNSIIFETTFDSSTEEKIPLDKLGSDSKFSHDMSSPESPCSQCLQEKIENAEIQDKISNSSHENSCSLESDSFCCSCNQKKSDMMTGQMSSHNSSDSARQLITYVTTSLETVPLEICQDIPDVMI